MESEISFDRVGDVVHVYTGEHSYTLLFELKQEINTRSHLAEIKQYHYN